MYSKTQSEEFLTIGKRVKSKIIKTYIHHNINKIRKKIWI